MKASIFRIGMNCHPLYFCTGGHVESISEDWKKTVLSLPLNWRTKNYVGTIFGGSLFSASDPFYMIMFIQILGPEYVVWDKAANIKFKRPGKGTVKATLEITDAEIALAKEKAQAAGEFEFQKTLQWLDAGGKVVSEIERTIYVATKEFYKNKRK